MHLAYISRDSARVTLVNWKGEPLYDTYVKPTGPVTSYRETATRLDETYFTDGQSTHLRALDETLPIFLTTFVCASRRRYSVSRGPAQYSRVDQRKGSCRTSDLERSPGKPVSFDFGRKAKWRILITKVLISKQVLGIQHPLQDTRDVALFLPFRSILGRPNEVIGLPTLMWRLMQKKVQEHFVDPVTCFLYRLSEMERLTIAKCIDSWRMPKP